MHLPVSRIHEHRSASVGGTLPSMRGTLLNTATVAIGASAGIAVGRSIPESYQIVALQGLGLVTLGLGVKMLVQSKNPLIAAAAMSLGGVVGLALGLQSGLEGFAHFARDALGQGTTKGFVDGMVTSFVLFCVGPMTLLGCLEDAIEGKTNLLQLKSTLDGIAAFFLAAASGAGVLMTAGLLLLFQGSLTLAAKPLSKLSQDAEMISEIEGVGGAIIIATGIGLLGIKSLGTANFLPAILFAPVGVLGFRRFSSRGQGLS